MGTKRMKTVVAVAGGSVVHVETPLGIVNIKAGLTDTDGRRVDSIEVLPDGGKVRSGFCNTRIVEPKNGETKDELKTVLVGQAAEGGDTPAKALLTVRALASALTGYCPLTGEAFVAFARKTLEEAGFLAEVRDMAEADQRASNAVKKMLGGHVPPKKGS